MTTLSTRLAAATSFTDELREECARLSGWELVQVGHAADIWMRHDTCEIGDKNPPELDLTEIVAEIERRWTGYSLNAENLPNVTLCQVAIFQHGDGVIAQATRTDRNIQLCAMTALAMALENERTKQ